MFRIVTFSVVALFCVGAVIGVVVTLASPASVGSERQVVGDRAPRYGTSVGKPINSVQLRLVRPQAEERESAGVEIAAPPVGGVPKPAAAEILVALAGLEGPPGAGAASLTAPIPASQRDAVAAPTEPQRPLLAIVIDDVGMSQLRSKQIADLPGPITMSFLTYADNLTEQTQLARAAGHQVLAHMSMEPKNARLDAGPDTLRLGMSEDEIERRITSALSQFDDYAGVNNHMGSRFTEYPEGMALVMAKLENRGLLFLDSRTTSATVGANIAREHGVPAVERDVFFDHDPAPTAIWDALAKLERIAQGRGFAVGIGHPREATLEVLREWLPALRARGFQLVPISMIADYTRR